MAIVVESTSNGSTTSSTTLTITKPSGVQVGDFLVAMLGVYASSPTISTASGWTLLTTQTCTNGLTSLQYKVADSGDVSASNYSWTCASDILNSGSILRISGVSGVSPLSQFDSDVNNTAAGADFNFTTSITPNNNGSLLLISLHGNDNNSDAAHTMSGYFVTGSSPTWVETHDFGVNTSGTADPQNAGAYALLATATALTAYGATSSGACDNQAGIFAVVAPRTDATGENTLVEADAVSLAQTGTADTVGTNTLVEATAEVFSQSGEDTVPSVWTPTPKS